tara:strand:+ start:429 stop:710 length:282 start_codon:yes stop_codon:yes gene_type:complete
LPGQGAFGIVGVDGNGSLGRVKRVRSFQRFRVELNRMLLARDLQRRPGAKIIIQHGAVLFDNGITCQAAYLAKTEADVVFFTSFLFAARLYYS